MPFYFSVGILVSDMTKTAPCCIVDLICGLCRTLDKCVPGFATVTTKVLSFFCMCRTDRSSTEAADCTSVLITVPTFHFKLQSFIYPYSPIPMSLLSNIASPCYRRTRKEYVTKKINFAPTDLLDFGQELTD